MDATGNSVCQILLKYQSTIVIQNILVGQKWGLAPIYGKFDGLTSCWSTKFFDVYNINVLM